MIKAGQKLVGESRNDTIIDFNNQNYTIVITSGLDDCVIENLSLRNSDCGSSSGAIDVYNADRTLIRNCYFEGNDVDVFNKYGFGAKIINNFFASTVSYHLWQQGSRGIVSGNHFFNADPTTTSLYLSSSYNMIVGNYFRGNGGSKAIDGASSSNNFNMIVGNYIEKYKYGILIQDDNWLVEGNLIFGGSAGYEEGIRVQANGDKSIIVGNIITSIGWDNGIWILSGAEDCIVANNNFVDGTFDENYIKDQGTRTLLQNNLPAEVLQETQYFRMKNTSGGALVVGDIVIMKAVAAGNEITTTTAQGDNKVFGMVAESISDNASGQVQTLGKTTALKVDGTTDIAIGDFIGTFTTAKIGMKAASGDMAIAIALEAYATDDSAGIIDALLISPRKI